MSAVNIQLTDAALAYIEKMITKEQGIGFRLSVKKTGCSGYAYFPQVVNAINNNDQLVETKTGAKIFIDTGWLDLLNGIAIDYVVDDKSGLKQKKLMITNPQETSRCGCGESFHLEK